MSVSLFHATLHQPLCKSLHKPCYKQLPCWQFHSKKSRSLSLQMNCRTNSIQMQAGRTTTYFFCCKHEYVHDHNLHVHLLIRLQRRRVAWTPAAIISSGKLVSFSTHIQCQHHSNWGSQKAFKYLKPYYQVLVLCLIASLTTNDTVLNFYILLIIKMDLWYKECYE